MASETVRPKLKIKQRNHAIMRDGRRVLVYSDFALEQRRAARNLRRWNQGLRPNRFGIWR